MGQRLPTPPLPALIGQQLQFTQRIATPSMIITKRKGKNGKNNFQHSSMIQSRPTVINNRDAVYTSPRTNVIQREKLSSNIKNSTIQGYEDNTNTNEQTPEYLIDDESPL